MFLQVSVILSLNRGRWSEVNHLPPPPPRMGHFRGQSPTPRPGWDTSEVNHLPPPPPNMGQVGGQPPTPPPTPPTQDGTGQRSTTISFSPSSPLPRNHTGTTVNGHVVRILLECNLVLIKVRSANSLLVLNVLIKSLPLRKLCISFL